MNYTILIIFTILIILLSWFLSIKHKRYHGFARFFSFESILILILLNINVWFHNPFTILQLVSWFFLLFSIYPVVAGVLLLNKVGKPETNLETTTVLVKKGIYKYIRHPLYLSLFLFGTGIVLKNPGTLQIILGVINALSVFLTSKMEEKEMISKFGNDYKDYMKETKMFIPFIL